MLVGEAPSDTDAKAGVPFTGGAGQLLEHAMSRAGLSMSECFLTNVTQVPAPNKNFGEFYKKSHQLAYLQGVMQLKRDIETIQPNVIVALGSHALKPLTSKDGIDKWRGSILECSLAKGFKVIGTYNPAYAIRVYEAKAIIELDMIRVKDESAFKDIVLPMRQHILHPPEPERDRIVDEMLQTEWLSVDIECWLDDAVGKWKLACVGFSDRPDRSLVIHNDSESARHAIRRLVDSPIKKIYQNGMFDVTVLRDEGYECPNFAWDTMYAHHCLFMEAARGEDEISKLKGKKKLSVFKKGLGFQASIYTREPYYKDDGKLWKQSGDLSLFWLYNGRDAAVTHEIKQVQDRELDEFGVRRAFDREMRAAEPLMSATRRGIRIDLAVRDALKSQYENELVNLQSFLDGQAGKPINVKGKDINWLLYDKLKLPVKYNKKTGNESADKFALQELAHKYNHPMLMTVLAIRERRDYLEKYINVPLSADGRIRCSFDLTGTQSGRLSSRSSLDGSGTNLQNIPSRKKVGELVKRMFVTDPGKVFVYRDFSQAEAWLVAYLARCEGLIELLNDPTRDIHKENAARIFNVPISEVTPEQRYLAKRVIHASNYGMGGDKLVLIVNEDAETTGVRINRQKADELIQKYFMIYPEIKQNFWREVESEVRHTRTLTTCMGRKRAFFGRMDDNLIRDAYSWKPQSTVGDLGIEALSNCYYDIELDKPELGAQLLLNVHDSILMQCNDDPESINATAQLMAEAMAIPMEVNGREFTIPSDCKVGRNWAKATPDNPAGLRDIDKPWTGLYDVA
jgi:uracil-DNA glycosylase family 4